jgi:hypothetical protein
VSFNDITEPVDIADLPNRLTTGLGPAFPFRSSHGGRNPGPGVPDNQPIEDEADGNQEVVVPADVGQAKEIEHDKETRCHDADPADCGLRHRKRQDNHDAGTSIIAAATNNLNLSAPGLSRTRLSFVQIGILRLLATG